MPKARAALHEFLPRIGGLQDHGHALSILTDIAEALAIGSTRPRFIATLSLKMFYYLMAPGALATSALLAMWPQLEPTIRRRHSSHLGIAHQSNGD